MVLAPSKLPPSGSALNNWWARSGPSGKWLTPAQRWTETSVSGRGGTLDLETIAKSFLLHEPQVQCLINGRRGVRPRSLAAR